jgi:amino acid adenylation domain-containing protein
MHDVIAPQMLTSIELDQAQIDAVVRTVRGGASNVQDIFPLSPLQEGMLFHRLLNERSDTYVLSILFELHDRADFDSLVEALQKVIDRHDALRTAVLWEQLPRPIQVVYRRAALLSEELTIDDHRDALERLKDQMRPGRVSLDPGRAPIGRLQVAAAPDGKCYALLQLHHLICDHRSLSAIVAELSAFMEARDRELPPPGAYRAHVQHALEQVRAEAAEAFFRHKLASVDEPSAPFGLLDVHGDGSRIEETACMLDPLLAQRIRTRARSMGVSAARLFHAAWALIVALTSGRDEVIFGTVLLAAAPKEAQAERALGMAVNTLPLRLRLHGISAQALVEQTHQELQELLKHAHVPLTLAQHCSGIAAPAPLFTALLNYRHSAKDWSLGQSRSNRLRVLSRGEAWTNYPLTLLVDDLGEGFLLTAQTDRSVAPARVIDCLQAALGSLLNALQEAPQTPALSLSILSQRERDQILDGFNATAADYDGHKLIHQLFEEQVERTPHALAACFENDSLTYRELNRRANQLARHLRTLGVGPDQLAGIFVERSLEMVVGLLGVLKAGGAYVPIDPDYPAERLEYMLRDAAPRVLLTLERLRSRLPATTATIIALDAQWPSIAGHDAADLDPAMLGLRSEHLAYVIYTSGSTGTPKGAMNEHRALINRLQWMQDRYRLGPADRVLQKTPFSFDVSVWEFFWTLASGARLIIARPQGHQDPRYLSELIEETAVTTLHFVPSMLQAFLDEHRVATCPSVRRVICSGEELTPTLQNRCLRALPQARLSNLYGPTEAAIDVTAWECRLQAEDTRVPIGQPIANVRMYVLNAMLQPVPIGAVGEIYIGGAGVGRGYWNRPDLTAERFIADPFATDPSARLYKTGDLGRWRPDGAIEYLGRNDHQVKIRGLRIELGEIETHLARHARVKDAVVVASAAPPVEQRLVAYVTPRDSAAPPTVEELRTHLKSVLPEYMVPSAFVVLQRMPLSANGKLDRRALPAPALDAYASAAYEAPQGEVEEILAGVWQALLGLELVGRRDNFFALGGHSLLIVQMLERLRRVGFATDARRVFASATLADLARTLSGAAVEQFEAPPNGIPPACAAITPSMLSLVELESAHIRRIAQDVPGGMVNIQDVYPLAPLQEGILFHHLLDCAGGDTYVLPTLLAVESRQRVDELIVAIQAVVDRHDVLRTAVLWEELPRPVQVVYRRAALTIDEAALNPERDALEQVREWLEPERQRVDLRRAPLLWLRVAQDFRSGQHYVLLQLHHITIDHVAAEVVTAEIIDHLEGRAARPPESAPYRNHVAQTLAYARTNDAEAFFRCKFGDLDEPTMPFGLLEARGDGTQSDTMCEQLPADLARRVRVRARRLGVSAATLFHAAWALVVARTSCRDDVVFGSVLLGRLQGSTGAQRVLGMFINTLPLRVRLAGVTAQQLVEHTQRELIELLSHEQASLAAAQRCSGIGGAAPLFGTLLNYRHQTPDPQSQWSAARGIRLQACREWTSYPITVSVDDQGEGFGLTAQTDRRVEPQRVIAYLRAAVAALVDALEQESRRAALDLSILPPDEQMQVIESFNATRAPYSRSQHVHELFEQQVERTPNAVAVAHGHHRLSYAELNRKANQLARHLRHKGVGPGQLAAICMERSP